MSVFTRTTRRIAKGTVVGALGLALVMGSTACGSGKISQTNNKEAAINGAHGTLQLDADKSNPGELPGSIAVRNLQIMYPVDEASKVFGAGGPFQLVFTIANDSQVRHVKLTGITAPKGKVTLTPADDTVIGPNGFLAAGEPSNWDDVEKDGLTRVKAELNGTGETVAPGLTVPLTLNFEVYNLPADKDGKPTGPSIGKKSITVSTPVDSTALNERVDVIRDVQPKHGDGGHH
ncbi:MAG: copper-binding protein [Gordonia sp. (in: high G+C Gram-positive bacteria)]|uniref:copper-binding protein n=1 Tax=Gordonia sp. (in: high G+C Gram-positive bacteria) TaxID=84139 RepID=UPI0039E68D43